MTDLTKLTTDELVHLVAGHMPATAEEIRRRLEVCEEYSAGFALRWDSDMRAIQRWQKVHPGMNALVWPDHTDLSVWLLERLEKCEAVTEALVAWDNKWPKTYVMNQSQHQQSEKEFDAVADAARAALEEKS